jgi:hypothetical protein
LVRALFKGLPKKRKRNLKAAKESLEAIFEAYL